MYDNQNVSMLFSLTATLSEDDCDINCSNTILWCTQHNLAINTEVTAVTSNTLSGKN